MDSYRQFLEEFVPSHPVELAESESMPFRMQVFYLNDDDLDAELQDWCHQYLSVFKCPWQLANQIALKTVENMKKFDLSEYYEEMHDDDQKAQSTDGDNKDQIEADSEKKDEDEKKLSEATDEEEGWSKLEFKEEKHAPRLMAELVAPLVFMEVRRVCSEMHGNLPNIRCNPEKYETSSHAIRNTRRKMEDRHIVIPDINDRLGEQLGPPTSFYGVYDGHGGVDGANYTAAHLHHFMVRNKNYTTDLSSAILDAYKQTDEEFIAKSKLENVGCGSTAVTAVFRDKTLYVTWLGDSQALLVRNGQPVNVMNPHKPEREDERQRIEALGGCVVWFGAWRVNGNLSVSRAIGDHEHKPFVSGEPDMVKIDLEGNEDYLVLACDGLWDTLMPNALVELVQDHIKEHGSNIGDVAQLLVKAAKEQGSNDNITVIVVFLKDAAKILETQSASDSQSEKISENNNPDKGSDSKDPSNDSGNMGKDGQPDSKESDKDSGNPDKDTSVKDEGNKENVTPLLCGILEISSGSSDDVVILGSSDSVHMSGSGSDFNKDSSNNETSDEFLHAQVSSDSGHSPGPSDQGSRSGGGYQKPMIIVSSESGESESVSNGTSPNGSEEKQTTGTDSHGPSSDQSLTRVDIHSNTSGTDLALMSKTASKCLSNRKAKRSKNGSKNGPKNGRNGHHNGHRHSGHHPKEGRRFSRGRINSTSLITYRTLSAPPRSRSAESDLALAQRNMLRSGDQIFEMLTGCSPSFIRKTSSSSKWTVAVEMEAASSLFPDNRLLAEDRRRSDTPQHYRKK